MGFGQAVATCLAKYARFQGRAHRPEYWWWILFVILYAIAVWIVALIRFSIFGTSARPSGADVGPSAADVGL